MTTIPVSVIIVSRHRAVALARCLTGLRQSDHPAFEVIVVADPAAVADLRAQGLPIKLAAFDLANISAARNLGLRLAAAPLVAFIDDDAVPEPTWLARLVAPFADPRVVAATGFVRGRNGISFQWRAAQVDAHGCDHPLAVAPEASSLHAASPRRAVKTQGTNCAFRRDALLAMGGFDESFWFYLDEADVNMRMARSGATSGALTAVVPLAQVHHGFDASARRRGDRVPLSLHEIGASSMIFLRRHATPVDFAPSIARLRAEQRTRALRLMIKGAIEPREVGRLMATLETGLTDGAQRVLPMLAPLPATDTAFLPMPETGPRAGVVIAGRPWHRATCKVRARAAVAKGAIATVFILSPTALFHRHVFHPDGYWMQQGGIFGRSDRDQPLMQIREFSSRLAQEIGRICRLRPVAGDISPHCDAAPRPD